MVDLVTLGHAFINTGGSRSVNSCKLRLGGSSEEAGGSRKSEDRLINDENGTKNIPSVLHCHTHLYRLYREQPLEDHTFKSCSKLLSSSSSISPV